MQRGQALAGQEQADGEEKKGCASQFDRETQREGVWVQGIKEDVTYTPAGFVSNIRYDFGSILRFIEQNFSIPEGSLQFADARSKSDLTGFFHFYQPPRAFRTIRAAKDAQYFLNDKSPMEPPDND